MGSSCSSVKRKDRQRSRRSSSADSGPHVDLCGQRRCSERSIESLPYGAKSSPPSTSKSSQQQEVSAASRSNGDTKHPTTDGNQTMLDSAHASRDDKFLAVSSASPLPASPTVSPFSTPSATKQSSTVPDLAAFTSGVRSLLLGQEPDEECRIPVANQIFLIVCCNPRDTNFKHIESIFSHLRQLCNSKGYEFHVVDFYLPNECKPIGDHSYDDICLQALKDFNENATVLNLFVEEADERVFSLPKQVDEQDFDSLLESITEDSKHLFKKWYLLDRNSLCPQFILQHISKHFPHLLSDSVETSKEAVSLWNSECVEMCKSLDSCAVDDLKRKYLLSAQQKQIGCVLANPAALKRSFLVRFEPTNTQADARFECILSLEQQLPEQQKVCVSTASDVKLNDGITALVGCLKKVFENMIDDKSQEESQLTYNGITSSLYCELIQQERIRSEMASNCVGYESLIKRIEAYISSSSKSPIVLYGQRGCGKSAFIAKFSRFCCLNITSFVVVHRSVGVSEESLTREQLFRSVCEQCCALYGEEGSSVYSNLKESLANLMKKVPTNRSLLLLIDGIDQLDPFTEFDTACLPQEIPANIKIIFTATLGSTFATQCKNVFGEENMIEVPSLSVEESFRVFTQSMDKKKRKTSNAQNDAVAIRFQNCHSPVYAHLLANEAVHWRSDDLINESVIPKDTSSLVNEVLKLTGQLIGTTASRFLFSLLCVSKHGFTDDQLVALLSWKKALEDSLFIGNRFPYVYWLWMKNRFNYLFATKLLGGKLVNSLRCSLFKQLLNETIPKEFIELSRERIVNFFKENVDLCSTIDPTLQRVAIEELPFAALQSNEAGVENTYIFNMEWLAYKLRASDSFHVLEDIDIYEKVHGKDEDSKLLKDVLSVSAFALRYDGAQIFSQLYARLKNLMNESEKKHKYPKMKALFEACYKPSLTSLLPLNTRFMNLRYDESSSPLAAVRDDSDETFCFLSVIKGKTSHIVSLSSETGKIVVWDVYQEKAVRTLTGITQPRNLKMIDEHRALVLCNRELKVYNLDSGILESKLKGVMNQNMPFYGLHDEKYVVALSRNRMYVNMLNVVTGDLETQFKVGEDRFLNSLLVSVNGKICVCGDETQKPFPLLVWDLSSRKLLYDLRIPHHEFITRLAAISDDGHYVVSVCKELSSTAPNFIIVYDLQSGTLFKKWKPECNTSSIAISSQGGFVLNGIENCRILVWDLSTGAKRHNLIGHSAPVDTLQIDESGKSCLSFDSFAKDHSIRIWDAESGTCLAVFTPDYPLSCCQLSSDGKLVVFCFKRCSMLHTLQLCRHSSPESELVTEPERYGQIEFDGLVFDLNAS